MQLRKFDSERQIVYGEVYVPNVPDSQGDFMTEETILQMAHRFLASGRVNKVDTDHNNVLNESYVVESFIARPGDPDFIEGAWVAGVHIPNRELWQAVKSGEINGFSLEGNVIPEERKVALYVPEVITGTVEKGDGHKHKYRVRLSDDGLSISGSTVEDGTGHQHEIRNGTITEEADGHTHRYNFIDALDHLEVLS